MKRYSSAVSLALAVVVVLGLAGPAAAGVQVPFKGRLVGVDTGTPLVPPITFVEVKATGNATQLGKFTFIELVTVNTATGLGSGTFLFTAANGDTVFGTISGKATFTPPNVLPIVETAIITGGTGRFAGATGSFTVARLKNTVTGLTTASFTGTVSAPGPLKHKKRPVRSSRPASASPTIVALSLRERATISPMTYPTTSYRFLFPRRFPCGSRTSSSPCF